MDKPAELLSIIITCYNDADFIDLAINSSIYQSYSNKEIIVVDDGSDEQTKEKLKTLESKVSLIITQENKGVSAARNKGIERARGTYISVLDSDDYFENIFCEKAIDILENSSEVKMVSSKGRWFWDDENFEIFTPSGGDLYAFMFQCGSFGSAIFRKRDWFLAGGYDEKMRLGFEDWEFFIRVLSTGGSVFIIPEVLFHYRKRSFSKSTTANKYKYDLLQYIYLKHAHLYSGNYESTLRNLILQLKKEENEKNRLLKKIDYRIGSYILKPFRKIKFLWRRL